MLSRSQIDLQRRVGEKGIILQTDCRPLRHFLLFRNQIVAPSVLENPGGILPDPAEFNLLALGIGAFPIQKEGDLAVLAVAPLIDIRKGNAAQAVFRNADSPLCRAVSAELQRILIQMRHCGHCVGQDGLFERQEYIVASVGFPSAFAQILEILPLRSCIRYPGSPIRRVGFLRRREQASRDEQQQRQSAAAKPFGHTMGRLQHSSPPFLFVRSLRGIAPPLILCG